MRAGGDHISAHEYGRDTLHDRDLWSSGPVTIIPCNPLCGRTPRATKTSFWNDQ